MEYLKGKSAIVTGASKGIGLEVAKQLINAGVKVAGWSRSAPPIADERFYHVEVDVASYEEVQSAFNQSVEILGDQIHFLVNNAGYGVIGAVDELSIEDWKGMFDVNVHGLMYCIRAVVPQMKAMDQGHIVNISSVAGRNPVKNMSAYVATKHAVTGFGHSLFMELRDFGIKVSNVYPGSTSTQFFDAIDEIDAHDHMMRPQDVAKSVIDLLNTHENYLPVDLEIRPLRPKGK
ncbi:MAG: SDR family NAD(P)-dependent oxidoreductase [Cyclobacteriaceae bacterium]